MIKHLPPLAGLAPKTTRDFCVCARRRITDSKDLQKLRSVLRDPTARAQRGTSSRPFCAPSLLRQSPKGYLLI